MSLCETECPSAIPLIYVDESGKYRLHTDGMAFLQTVPKPMAVISVAGLYRTGKSFLLNRVLLDRNKAFGVGNTTNACTKGLWLWGAVLKGSTASGEKINVVVIDTEGIGALDEEQTHDVRVFTLAILSSSSFIYNSVGAIDENALQNLGLVVNLSRHIQLTATSNGNFNQSSSPVHNESVLSMNSQLSDDSDAPPADDENDAEQLAKFFPKFTWVLRDFALQLVDADGEALTPNQYLERSLLPQKGFTDDIEDKNRIRRLLTTYFVDRECFTLVRPVVNEAKLQRLDEVDTKELRVEFVEQMLNIRKRILNRAKPKTFNGNLLDGSMLTGLLSSYTEAINNGAIPNIRSAWIHVCAIQCEAVVEEVIKSFVAKMDQIKKSGLPRAVEELDQILREEERTIIQQLTKKLIGDDTKLFIQECRKRLIGLIDPVRAENERKAASLLRDNFMKAFAPLEKRVMAKTCASFTEFSITLTEIMTNLQQTTANLPYKELTYSRMLRKALQDGGQFFIRSLRSEKDKEIENVQEKLTLSQAKVETLSRELNNTEDNLKKKINSLETRNRELTLSVAQQSEAIERLRTDKNKQIEKLQRNIDQLGKNNSQLVEESKTRNFKLEEIRKELTQQKLEYQRQMALMELKIRQLEADNSNRQTKITALDRELSSLKDHQKGQIQSSTLLIKEELNRVQLLLSSVESKYQELQDQYKEVRLEKETAIRSHMVEMEAVNTELNRINRQTQNQLEEKDRKNKNQRQNLLLQVQELEGQLERLKTISQEAERSNRATYETMRTKQTELEQQLAILNQSYGFAQEQTLEVAERLKKTIESYELKLKNTQSLELRQQLQREREVIASKLRKAQDNYEIQLKSKENAMNQLQRTLTQQNEAASHREQSLKLQIQSLNAKLEFIQREQTVLREEIEQLKSSMDSASKEYEMEIQRKEKSYIVRIQQLDSDIESLRDEKLDVQQDAAKRSDDLVTALKGTFELERAQLETMLAEERQRHQNSLQKYAKQHEERMQREIEPLEAELQALREEILANNEEYNETVSTMQHQLDMIQHAVEVSQKNLAEQRVRFEQRQKQLLVRDEVNQKAITATRQELETRCTELRTAKDQYDREISFLTHQNGELRVSLKEKEDGLVAKSQETIRLEANISKLKEDYQSKFSELQKQFMETKMKYETKGALDAQQREFSNKKIEELHKSLTETERALENTSQKLRAEFSFELTREADKHKAIYEQLERKYDNLKKTSAQRDTTALQTQEKLFKECSLEREKSNKLEQQLNSLKIECEQLVAKVDRQKEQLRQAQASLKQTSENQMYEMSLRLSELESEKVQLKQSLERQKMLMEKRISYLEDGKERYRKQAADTGQKLAQAVQNSQRARTTDEANHKAACAALEEIYMKKDEKSAAQIKQLRDSLLKKETQHEAAIMKIQSALNAMSQRRVSETASQMANISTLERKLRQSHEQCRRLTVDLDKAKNSESRLEAEHKGDNDKSAQTAKLLERDERLKMLEKQKQDSFLAFERERSKWTHDIQSQKQRSQDLKSQLAASERENSRLSRQIQKLKTEKRCSNNKFAQPSRMSLSRGHSNTSGLNLNNTSLNSSITENSIIFGGKGTTNEGNTSSKGEQGSKRTASSVLAELSFFGNAQMGDQNI